MILSARVGRGLTLGAGNDRIACILEMRVTIGEANDPVGTGSKDRK
jgi:hypothetical protein